LIINMHMYCRTAALSFLLLLPVASAFCSGSEVKGVTVSGTYTSQPVRHPDIEFNSKLKLLKVNAEQCCLDEILTEISETSNVEFIGLAHSGCEKVSIQIDDMPLQDAMKHLLRGRSYIIREGINEHISVWMLPVGDAERLTEMDIKIDEFYNSLAGSQQAKNLADQIRSLEQ